MRPCSAADHEDSCTRGIAASDLLETECLKGLHNLKTSDWLSKSSDKLARHSNWPSQIPKPT